MDLIIAHGTNGCCARFDGRAWPCAIGRGGVIREKHEGDGATPIGCWPMRRVLYRPDRVGAPATA
ncbi:MAG: L,D-transpeptidase family protein, partial [Alphaproteobacteria bacterium]